MTAAPILAADFEARRTFPFTTPGLGALKAAIVEGEAAWPGVRCRAVWTGERYHVTVRDAMTGDLRGYLGGPP